MGVVVAVREADRMDIPALSHLQQEFVAYLVGLGDTAPGAPLDESQWQRIFSASHLGCLIAESERDAAGYLAYHHGYDLDRGGEVLYVFDLFVRQRARKRGIGRALMEEAARVCARIGGAAIIFNVWKRNVDAIAFYTRLGALPLEQLQYMHLPVQR